MSKSWVPVPAGPEFSAFLSRQMYCEGRECRWTYDSPTGNEISCQRCGSGYSGGTLYWMNNYFAQIAEHDARATELLAANNLEVERRREAEAALGHLSALAQAAVDRVDRNLDTIKSDFKYAAPWAELTALRTFLAAISAPGDGSIGMEKEP